MARFESGIPIKYRIAIEKAFATIIERGNDFHRYMMNEIVDSGMLVRVVPVAEINGASGVTGVTHVVTTNFRMATERLSLQDALGEIYIAIAKETIDTGGQRGCEGTFVHEGRHAYDFAQTLESMSNADVNPLSVFNPTLFELEWEAHKAAADYMLCIGHQEYLDEGLQLLILGTSSEGGCFVDDEGIRLRLDRNYGLSIQGNQGRTATQMMGIVV
jgi:hypothetical protein